MTDEQESLQELADCLEDYVSARERGEVVDSVAFRERLGPDYELFANLLTADVAIQEYLEEPDSMQLPRSLGPYLLERELGRGAMGVVYEATHRTTNRRVAVKVLRLGFIGRSGARARFRREAQALARVRHPNAVDFIEAGEDGDQPYYVMSMVEGESLDVVLRGEGKPECPTLCKGLADVAGALHVMHEAGLVHRDVKPSNIIVTPDERMVLADFGLAWGDDFLTLTRAGAALGTPPYMSPEQVRGAHDEVDARTDVYGLGATLYHVLTGGPPFGQESLQKLTPAILEERPRAPHSLNPDVGRERERIALKCLEKRPEDRYASAAELRDDLRACASGRPVTGRPVPRFRRGLRALRARPLVTAAVLLGAVAAGWLLLRTEPARLRPVIIGDAEVVVNGTAHGRAPVGELVLKPGVPHTVVLRPVDERCFCTQEYVITLEEGELATPCWPLRLNLPNDPECVAKLAKAALSLESKKPTRGSWDRTASTALAQAVFPRGRVRPQDLDRVRVDVSRAWDGTATLFFRRGEDSLAEVADWEPSGPVHQFDMPKAVRATLRAGDVVIWGIVLPGGDEITAEFEVVSDDAAGDALGRLDEIMGAFEPTSDSHILGAILRARILVNAGLPLAAWQKVREQVDTGAVNLLLLNEERAVLEALFPDADERAQSAPWRHVCGAISERGRWSAEEQLQVFGDVLED